MKKHIDTALLLAMVCAAGTAPAKAADDFDHSVTGNVAVVSDYLFRGLTQTWGAPAIQGGGDFTMKNGLAAGFWASSISARSYPGACAELDFYASYGKTITGDWSWRAGVYSYLYPDGNLDDVGLRSRSFDTVEANASLAWKWLSLKYSHALTDYFGIDVEQGYSDGSKGTGYLELDAAIPFDETWGLALHAGRTDITTRLATPLATGADDPDYSDFGATLKGQFAAHWTASIGVSYADNHAFYGHMASFSNASETKNVGGLRGFAMLQSMF